MDRPLKETVYSPDSELLSFGKLLRNTWSDLLCCEHDLWYIQNWSLWLDLKILLMTPFVMIHRNAY
jgi:hypothetical protein